MQEGPYRINLIVAYLSVQPANSTSFPSVITESDGIVTTIQSPFKSREQREADRLAKREAVLLAAVRMFNERGFFSTTFDEVAASLGVSKPTIYHYLGNKEEVLLECLSRGISELKEAALKAAASEGTGVERLKAFMLRYVERNMDDFGRCVVRTPEEGLSPETSERFRALKKEIETLLRSMIQAAMDDGSIAQGDVKLVAATIVGALNWPARWYKPHSPKEQKALAEGMVNLLFNGVTNGIASQAEKPKRSRRKPVAA